MISTRFQKYFVPVFFLVLAILILWQMLLPGYVITLDMTWTPSFPLRWSSDGFNNAFPVLALIHLLAYVVPTWILQKCMLLSLFFLLFYLPYRFLPLIKDETARIFAACIFTLNPFVYSRMLSGQWMHLFGYALLPYLLYTLVHITREPNKRSALLFASALVLIALFSIHFLYIAMFVSGIWILVHDVRQRNKTLLGYALMAVGVFLLVQLYWIVPALLRETPIEGRFDIMHFEAFAPAANGYLPVLANVALLGGFWGEDLAWKYSFVWPQEQPLFLVGAGMIMFLVFFGIYYGVRHRETRAPVLLLCGIAVLAYLGALGAAETAWKPVGLFLYKHVPLFSGLRDSHKIVGVLALFYALCAGIGLERLFALFRNTKLPVVVESLARTLVFALPILFGIYMWGGFHGQLNPIWYPKEWNEAKVILDNAPKGEKALVLPWHGYLSLDFADQRVVSNPATTFFGRDRVVVAKTVEFGGIYDQEVDADYRELDRLVQNATTTSPRVLHDELIRRGIRYIIIIGNTEVPFSKEGRISWTSTFAKSSVFPSLLGKNLIESDSFTLRAIQQEMR